MKKSPFIGKIQWITKSILGTTWIKQCTCYFYNMIRKVNLFIQNNVFWTI